LVSNYDWILLLPKLNRVSVLSILLVVVILGCYGIVYPIQVSKVNLQTMIPQNLANNPAFKVFAQSLTNTSGDLSLTLQDFNFTSTELSTKVAGSSAILDVVITPQGQNARMDLNIQLNSVNVVSPSYTGRLSSLKMTGYVVVDPTTNKMILSIVSSTSVLDIIRGIFGI
jgi:hypothetical protein